MKILYVGSNRGDAVTVATILRDAATSASVVWTPHVDRAPEWIEQNPDVGALIVEAPVDHDPWVAITDRARRLSSHPAVVCIVPESAAAIFDTLAPPPDEIIVRNQSWFHSLPAGLRRAIGRAHARQTEIQTLLEREGGARADLERRLAAATTALADADERHRTAAATADQQLAALQQKHETSLSRGAATREMLEEQLRAAAIEVERGRQDQWAAAARVDQLSRRESELSSRVAEAEAARLATERRAAEDAGRFSEHQRELEARIAEEVDRRSRSEASLAESTADVERLTARAGDLLSRVAALDAARDAVAQELADARRGLERSAEREQELERRIEHERATHAALEQAVSDAHATIRAEQERHDAAAAAADADIAKRQAQFERERTEAASLAERLANRLADAEAALEQLRREHDAATAGVARLAEREADLMSQLVDVRTGRDALERRLLDAADAIQAANDRADVDRSAAAERERDLEVRLAQAHEESATLRVQAREQAADFETRLANQRREHEARMAETHEWNRRLLIESDAVRQSLQAVQERADGLDVDLTRMREELARTQSIAAADVERLTAERRETERDLEDARRSSQRALECLANEHDRALAALAAAVGERDAQLLEEEARFFAAQAAADTRRKELQDTFQAELAGRARDFQQLEATLAAVRQTLDAATRRQNVLQAEADQVPRLRGQLDESRAESDRLFQQGPLARFRCTKDGALTQANRAWTSLVYRKLEELRGGGVGATVFETPGDLSVLIQRCLATNATESIETTVRRKDGARLLVRLSAFASTAGAIEIAAENLTRVRVLQDRLDQARRMEAVGRLSSEVALNCAALLTDLQRKTREWLMGAEAAGLRQHGETLFDDLTRVAGSLQQLVAYADKKTRTAVVADLNMLVRDLAPVLKQIAGDDVDVQVQGSSAALSVDIETERIERILLNLAAHGRERLLSGGKLTIEVAPVMVDLAFAARHANVRPGPHALITVRESRRSARADAPRLAAGSHRDSPPAAGTRKMPIELAELQRLVAGCSGHLWMRILPQGDIVAKLRLPVLAPFDQPQPRALAALGVRSRMLTRWFQR
jgi:hypothetical protein